jgi:hypothetical protein
MVDEGASEGERKKWRRKMLRKIMKISGGGH